MELRDWIVGDLESLRMRLANGVVGIIPPERLTERVDGGGIAPVYVLWHAARHQDVAVNGVLRGTAPVLDLWADRVGIDADTWRGLAEAEDQDLVQTLVWLQKVIGACVKRNGSICMLNGKNGWQASRQGS